MAWAGEVREIRGTECETRGVGLVLATELSGSRVPSSSAREPSVAEFTRNAGSGLLDLTVMPIADLPQLDEATLKIAIDRLIQPCDSVNEDMSVIGGHVRIWQNYKTPD